jgi:hypothetical protein
VSLRGALRPWPGLLSALLLEACIVVPRTVTAYDPECRTYTHQMTLEVAVLGGFQNCAGDACAALLASLGVVAAASAVVSGSIVLAGNMVYWFERQQGCPRDPVTR